jgi:hypothetical protein
MSAAQQDSIAKPPSKAELLEGKLKKKRLNYDLALEAWYGERLRRASKSKGKGSRKLNAGSKSKRARKDNAAAPESDYGESAPAKGTRKTSKSKGAANFGKWKPSLKKSARSKSRGGALRNAAKSGLKRFASGELASAKADLKLAGNFLRRPSPKLALQVGKRLLSRKFKGPLRAKKLALGGVKRLFGRRRRRDTIAAAPESTGHGGLVAGACVFTVVACAVVALFLRARRQSQKAAPDQYETLA